MLAAETAGSDRLSNTCHTRKKFSVVKVVLPGVGDSRRCGGLFSGRFEVVVPKSGTAEAVDFLSSRMDAVRRVRRRN